MSDARDGAAAGGQVAARLDGRRAAVLLLLLATWGMLILLRLGQLALVPGERLRSAVLHESWVEGEIPAPRGCILDRQGRPLAWSVRRFRVDWRVPERVSVALEERAILGRVLGLAPLPDEAALPPAGSDVLLKDRLSAREVATLGRLIRDLSGVRLSSYTVREYQGGPAIRARVGQVGTTDGGEHGLSGEEKFQDAMLRGRAGRYRVMVDRQGRWIRDTWQKTVDILPGYDVYLPLTLDAPVAGERAR